MEETNRPFLITILGVMLGGAALINIVGLIYAYFKFPSAALIWALFVVLAGATSIAGLWMMKKWGVYVYLTSFAVGAASLFLFPPNGSVALEQPWMIFVVPAIYCAIVFPHWKRFQ